MDLEVKAVSIFSVRPLFWFLNTSSDSLVLSIYLGFNIAPLCCLLRSTFAILSYGVCVLTKFFPDLTPPLRLDEIPSPRNIWIQNYNTLNITVNRIYMSNAILNNIEISNSSLPLSDTAWGSVPFWTWTVIFAGLEAAGSHLYSPACLWVTLCMTRLDIKRPRESVGHVDDIDLLEYAGGRAWSGAGPSCKMIWNSR